MKYSVACNWDPELLERLHRESSHVETLFGQITDDPLGGGRGSFLAPKVTREPAKEFILEARKRGFHFNYLLNGACQDNFEMTREGNRNLFEHVEWVARTGADMVTVTLPMLLVWIKRHFPDFKVAVSSWARVANVKRAKYWEDLGADGIILAESATRDFTALRSMRRALRCKLEVIANPSCLYLCYLDTNHINMMSHSAQGGHVSGGFVLDHCQVYCQRMKLGRPDELIKARWVRPEDVGDYDEIGIDSLKLLERFRNTETLMQVVRAYEQRRFDGNLVELLTLPRQNAYNPPNLEYLIRPDLVNIDLMLEMADIFGYSFSDVMQIDNRALDGFAEHFKTHDCYHSSCDECGYCKRWAEKVVRLNKERHQAILKKFDAFIEAIINRQTLTENVLPDVSGVRLSPGATSVLESLMAFVPPPLAQIARLKIVHGASQITAEEGREESGTNGGVGTRAVVLAFWMGTPESSREPVRKALEQMGLWGYISAAGGA
ncbi:MAG TPA: U32 family peptidase [Thermodesulfobacteriota bacterium]|nr:U32 family peptidase [Thermodesulfobacteriota bacterium]